MHYFFGACGYFIVQWYQYEVITDDMYLSLQLAWTCYNFYQSTPTKLAGENYFFHSGQVSY